MARVCAYLEINDHILGHALDRQAAVIVQNMMQNYFGLFLYDNIPELRPLLAHTHFERNAAMQQRNLEAVQLADQKSARAYTDILLRAYRERAVLVDESLVS